jgi:hypothetical protein
VPTNPPSVRIGGDEGRGREEETVVNVIVFAIYLIFAIAPLVALIDISTRPAEQFVDSGQTKTTWIVALVVTMIFCGLIGSGLGVYYFVAVKPKLPPEA